MRVEQPRHRECCKCHYYSYYSRPGNRNHKDRTVPHGDLHAKQQFMHLPCLEIETREDADVCEGISKMLYNIQTLPNLAKSRETFRKTNQPVGGGGGYTFLHRLIPARHAVCREAASDPSLLCVCVLLMSVKNTPESYSQLSLCTACMHNTC